MLTMGDCAEGNRRQFHAQISSRTLNDVPRNTFRRRGHRQLTKIMYRKRNRLLLGQAMGFCICLLLSSNYSDAVSSIRKHVDEDKPSSPASPIVSMNSPLGSTSKGHPTLNEEVRLANKVVKNGDAKDPKSPTTAASIPKLNDIAPILSPHSQHTTDGNFSEPHILKTPLNRGNESKWQELQIQQDFLEWCATTGIRTNLTIHYFDYQDFRQEHTRKKFAESNDDDHIDMIGTNQLEDSFLQVRGLAATRDIQKGEVVISIPFSSMVTVFTTIDSDPVLNKVMGPAVRRQHDWEDEFYELALLTFALLYHRNLKKASPLYHYISILESSPTDSIPFLWSKKRLKLEAPEGVRRYARNLYKDIQDAHAVILSVLKREYAELFVSEVYSLTNFIWAFALVNSRHWHLPIPHRTKKSLYKESENQAPQEGIGDQLPPASSPTDEWMSSRGDSEDGRTLEAHSFLAPVADLLNFGPPCTRGSYNTKTLAFELVATCSFLKGQEVTYWYSDDCDDVIIANYGFTHPMVPACPTTEELRQEVNYWKSRSNYLQVEIKHSYDDLEALEEEVKRAHNALTSCNCDDMIAGQGQMGGKKSRKGSVLDKHDHIRGSHQPPDYERHGIRRKAWNHQKSDIGL